MPSRRLWTALLASVLTSLTLSACGAKDTAREPGHGVFVIANESSCSYDCYQLWSRLFPDGGSDWFCDTLGPGESRTTIEIPIGEQYDIIVWNPLSVGPSPDPCEPFVFDDVVLAGPVHRLRITD